jgi:hypothetical protein
MLQKLIPVICLFSDTKLEDVEECAFMAWFNIRFAYAWVQQCNETIEQKKFELRIREGEEQSKRSEQVNEEVREGLEAIRKYIERAKAQAQGLEVL